NNTHLSVPAIYQNSPIISAATSRAVDLLNSTFAIDNIELFMSAAQLRLLFRRRFAWLLALVLLLPIAQTVATWHLLSHVHSVEAEHTDGDHAHQHGHCHLSQL